MATRAVARSIARAFIALAPGLGAVPGAFATIVLAAPSCGFAFAELPALYPSAAGWLQTVTVVGVLVWVSWAVAFLGSRSWSSAVGGATIAGRLATVGSFLGGLVLGIAISLVAYSFVAGVEDMCEPVWVPVGLLWFLVLVGPVFVLYVVVEATFDARRRNSVAP
ncbi:MAG: hypothetical protein RL499_1235 [Actinomycetota bacterium]